MMYSCPRCDKLITPKEGCAGKCNNCGLEFSLSNEPDIPRIQEDVLIQQFTEQIIKSKKDINYYETAINILKASLRNVVILKKSERCMFFKVEDSEISCFLFRLFRVKSFVRIQFDYNPRYHGVKVYTPEQVKQKNMGVVKAFMDTRDFEQLIDIALSVYKYKTKKYGERKIPSVNSNFYIFR